MAESLTSHKSALSFFPDKNRIRKIREKSGYEIPGIFDQTLVNIHRNGLISVGKQKNSVIFTNLILELRFQRLYDQIF